MELPNWLAGLTNARTFANNPANNFQPTWGDALQGIGSSMKTHWNRNFANPQGAAPQGPQGQNSPVPLQTGIAPSGQGGLPALSAILEGLRGGANPYPAPAAPQLAPMPISVGTPGIAGEPAPVVSLPVSGSPIGFGGLAGLGLDPTTMASRWGLNNPLR